MSDEILIIEDEPLVAELVAVNLQHAQYKVCIEATYEAGLTRLGLDVPALAIIDVMLPGGDGFQLTRTARDRGVACPILLLTARGDTKSKVRGLDCGADDYLTKPFDVPELLARVRALLRRSKGEAPPPVVFGFESYWVRLDTGRALTNEGEISLSEKELRLMEFFIRNEDRVMSRTDILEEVWGMNTFPTDRTVDNFILRLRKLFEKNPDVPIHFVTARGRGYFFRK